MSEKIGPEVRALIERHYPGIPSDRTEIAEALAELTDVQSGLIALATTIDGDRAATLLQVNVAKRLSSGIDGLLTEHRPRKN